MKLNLASQPSEAISDEELDDQLSPPPTKGVTRVPRQQQNGDLENLLSGKDISKSPIIIQRKQKASVRKEENLDIEFLRLEAKKVALLEQNDEDDEDLFFTASSSSQNNRDDTTEEEVFKDKVHRDCLSPSNVESATSNSPDYGFGSPPLSLPAVKDAANVLVSALQNNSTPPAPDPVVARVLMTWIQCHIKLSDYGFGSPPLSLPAVKDAANVLVSALQNNSTPPAPDPVVARVLMTWIQYLVFVPNWKMVRSRT
ncbi:hypothetical protein FQR65_LT11868 [Abscondita terminalis]|nr:hypothetical protein FQR65_LT11868 [Abscondita terminalis]